MAASSRELNFEHALTSIKFSRTTSSHHKRNVVLTDVHLWPCASQLDVLALLGHGSYVRDKRFIMYCTSPTIHTHTHVPVASSQAY